MPTLVNIATFPQLAGRPREKFPGWSAHMRDLHERRYDTVRAARDAGIPVYVGTDAGGSLAHGLVATEVARARAGRVHGHPRPCDGRRWAARTGSAARAEEGAQADLVVYAADPREDLAALAAPSLVVLRGTPRFLTAGGRSGGLGSLCERRPGRRLASMTASSRSRASSPR